MNTRTITTPRLLTASMLALFFLLSSAITHVEAAANDSSINLKKDPGSGLFTLTIRDPNGIQEFSLSFVGRYNYGGGLSSCPKSFSSDNIKIIDPSDFAPVMPAFVIDCKNNKTELEIPPPVNGIANSRAVKKEVPPPSPPPPPKEEKKEGPLSTEDIQYPVSGLGNCQNETECRSYCDNTDRAKECLAFAKKYNLISAKEAQKTADKFLNVKNGPGGCNSWSSCEDYCSTVDHLDQCIAFAEKTEYYSPAQLAEARKFQALVKAGKQFPGGCKDRNACEIYCGDSNHMEECVAFAEESGFMSKEEIGEAKKFMDLMRKGESPGGCASKEQCENYCFEGNHVDECVAFAQKAGVMTAEEAEMVKKTGGKGPGGCHSKAQCETYCEANSDECFQWARENGLVSEADLKKMGEGMKSFRANLDKMPPEVTQCLKDAVGQKNFDKMVNGQPIFDRSMEGKMKSCFNQLTSQVSKQFNALPPEASQCIKDTIGEDGLRKLQSGEFDENVDFSSLEKCFQQLQKSFGGGPGEPGGSGGPGGFSGPGGCKSIDECTAYCQANPKECQDFAPPGGGGSGGGFPGGGATGGGFPGGPGGCKSQEECTAYCQAHLEECKNFGPPGGGGGGTGGGGGGTPPPSPTSSCVPPPSGLVSWWSADLVSGATVPDITKSNNGTISGGVTIVPMEVGNAFQFDGSSGYISMGNPGSLNFGTGPFSLEAWFNWNGTLGTSAKNIIRKSNYGPDPGSGYWLRVGANELEFSVGGTLGPVGQSIITAPINAGVWHHAVAVRDNSGAVKLYVDGESKGTILRQTPDSNSTSEVPFLIGAWSLGGGASEFFNGQIDEIAVYARALDSSEVHALFDAGSVGKCATSFGRTNRELPQEPIPTQIPQTPSYPQAPGGAAYEIPVTPELCANFTSIPACSYVGSPDSQNYQLCKKCYPDR